MMNAYPRWSFLAVALLGALGSAACSDPVPPPAQGALTLSVGQPVVHVDGRACPAPGITYQIAATDSKTKMVAAPSSITPGESLISGEQGSKISCSVKKSSSGFAFSGSIHGNSQPSGSVVDLQMQAGTIDATSLSGTVNVTVYTPELSGNFASVAPCTVNVLQSQIKGGSMWASFSCPTVQYDPSGACGISSFSTVVFENCDGS
jgi:hypothetical protein